MKLVIIDGNSIFHQAYHALPPLTDSKGRQTGAIAGFLNIALALLKTAAPTHIGVVFDRGGGHRKHLLADYKANRERMDDDLHDQMIAVRKIVKLLNWKTVKVKGFEADDIVAALALQGVKEGLDTTIYSSDKDFIQLLPKGVKLYLPISKNFRTPKSIVERYGVAAEDFLQFQIFIGDSIDNVKGFKGIGAKTAVDLINEFGTVKESVAMAHKTAKPKVRQILINSVAQAHSIEAGVTLITDMKFKSNSLREWLRIQPYDSGKLSKFLAKFDLKQLSTRLANEKSFEDDGEKGLFDY